MVRAFWHKNRRFFLFLGLLLFFGGPVVFSQSFQEIRQCLIWRDRLALLKGQAEKLAMREHALTPMEIQETRQNLEKELAICEDEVKKLDRMHGPLADYYKKLLQSHIEGTRQFFPAIEKRMGANPAALSAPPLSSSSQETMASASVDPVVPSSPVVIPATSGITLVTEAQPALASLPPVITVSSSTLSYGIEGLDPESKARRKRFFHPIWPRLLVVKKLKRPATPLTPPASMPVSLPKAPVPLELPQPVAFVPTSITPMIPATGNDPQIRQSPGMRPLAIMIENHSHARPQTGLGEAEVVYEIPVEGGITRFMALFYHVTDVIGPVRSCRDYFIDRALEVNALYVHCGGSPQGYKYISTTKVFAIDEISNSDPFFRDKTRKAPHNLYAKMQKIINYAHRRHPMELPYQKLPFLYGKPVYSSTPNRGLTIRYHGNYSVSYRFNDRFNVYDRYMNTAQHLDRVTFRPVSPGTVIVQEAAMKVIDDQGRQDISFIGEGKGYVLAGGTITRITWKKSAPREFTRYFDEKGQPMIFNNEHPIWVQVIASRNQVAFDPPLPEDGPPANRQAAK